MKTDNLYIILNCIVVACVFQTINIVEGSNLAPRDRSQKTCAARQTPRFRSIAITEQVACNSKPKTHPAKGGVTDPKTPELLSEESKLEFQAAPDIIQTIETLKARNALLRAENLLTTASSKTKVHPQGINLEDVEREHDRLLVNSVL